MAGAPAALALAALLALAACGGGNGNGSGNFNGGGVAETFREPPVFSSTGGELQVNLQVASSTVEVDGTQVTTTLYNGLYMPPVLRLKPGDTLKLRLDNRSAAPTNEHYHGLNVSPRINANGTTSDNVFVHLEPGRTTDYEVAIPTWHNPGLYWYHSHQHGSAEQQVMGGLSGGMVIEGLLDPVPALYGVRERVLLLKDIQIGSDGRVPADIDSSAPTHRTVNGQTNPTMVIAPGETQLLRIGNISANMYYRLQLPGHTFHEIARDGNRRNQPVAYSELLLPPASRSEVLIQGGPPGTYALRSLDVNTGPQGDTAPATTLLTLVSQGRAQVPRPLPQAMPSNDDLRPLPVARKRTITFQESADGNSFYIDSGNGNGPVQFDMARVDSTIEAGTVEEWTVLNPTGEWHVFHIHQTDFQVVEQDGVPQPFIGHQDNVNVSYQADASSPPGQVKLLIDFRNPNIVGKFVYHCHIMEHEDGGMMAVAQVVPGPQTAAIAPGGTLGRLASAAWSRLAAWLPDDARAAREAEEARRAGDELLARLQEEALCRADNVPSASSDRAAQPAPLPVAGPRAAPPSLAATRIRFEPAGGSAAR